MVEERLNLLESELRKTEEGFGKLYEENELLKKENEELREKIDFAEKTDVKALLVKYILQRTPINTHKLVFPGVDRSRAPEVNFDAWQRGIEENYKKKQKLAEKEAVELRKVLFKTKMDLFMKVHPDYSEIPFVYCDVNGQLLCTPLVYDIFSIEKEKELGLVDLLNHVEREDAKYIFKSLKAGQRLKDYKLKDPRSITVNSYPLFYSDLPVGIAMILKSPDLDFEFGKLYKFVRNILTEVKKMSNEYNLMTARVRNGDLKSKAEDYL